MKTFDRIFLIVIFSLSLLFSSFFTEISAYDEAIMTHIDYSDQLILGNIYLGGIKPTTNPTEGQQSFGPFSYYLFAPIRFFTKDYLDLIIFMRILASLAVGLTYLFLLKFFNRKIAIVASIFYAFSPWYLFLGSTPSTHALLPIFVILNFYFLFSYIFNNHKTHLIYLAIVLGLVIQLYLASLSLILIDFIAILILKKLNKENLYSLAFGVFVFLLFLTPFTFNSYLNNGDLFASFREVLEYPLEHVNNNFLINIRDSFGIPLVLGTNYFGSWLFGSSMFLSKNLLFFNYITSFFLVLFILLGGINLLSNLYKNRDKKYLVLFIWLFIPITMMIIRNKNIAPYYYMPLFPIQYIFLAFGFSFLFFKSKKKYLKSLLIILIVLLIFSHGLFSYEIFKRAEQLGGSDGTYGIPYKYKLQAVNYIISKNNTSDVYTLDRHEGYNYLFRDRNFQGKFIVLSDPQMFNKIQGYVLVDITTLDSNRGFRNQSKNFLNRHQNSTISFGKLNVVLIE